VTHGALTKMRRRRGPSTRSGVSPPHAQRHDAGNGGEPVRERTGFLERAVRTAWFFYRASGVRVQSGFTTATGTHMIASESPESPEANEDARHVDQQPRRTGDDADVVDVMQELRRRYTTPHSLRSHTSKFRRLYDGGLDESGERAAAELSALANTELERRYVSEFVASYGRLRWQDTGNRGLDAHAQVCRKRLLPAHVRSVAILPAEKFQSERMSRTALREKHANVHVVRDGDALLRRAERILASADAHGLYDLALALLLVTGRRTVEILNGVSTFAACPDDPHACVFTGQAKRRRDVSHSAAASYPIPLLVPCDLVAAGLAALRAQQARRCTTPRAGPITNEQVSRQYQSSLGQHLRNRTPLGEEAGRHPHGLRALYVTLVHSLFDCPQTWSLQELATRVCGHSDIAAGLAYTAVVCQNVSHGRLGSLPAVVAQHEHESGTDA
jgi:hypothetical protein